MSINLINVKESSLNRFIGKDWSWGSSILHIGAASIGRGKVRRR